MLKIAFGCQSRVGKDTACDYLVKKHGGEVRHFSAPLYKILNYAQDICGFPKEKDTKFLQWVGTEWAREKDPDIWANLQLDNFDKNVFIADLRFPNELEKCKENGFICVRIIREGRIIDRNTQHESEIALLQSTDWDHIIINDGDLDSFYRKLDEIV